MKDILWYLSDALDGADKKQIITIELLQKIVNQAINLQENDQKTLNSIEDDLDHY